MIVMGEIVYSFLEPKLHFFNKGLHTDIINISLFIESVI